MTSLIFYTTLALLLFVGDGKKSIVDVVGMAGAIALGISMLLRKNIRLPSESVVFWWAAFLLYLLVRLPFSDSIAYSLYATIRFFIAFLLFIIFANGGVSTKEYARGVMGITFIALAVSLVMLFVPPVRAWMPEMSLLSNAYGHHHVAYLLIFALPFAVRMFLSKQSWVRGSLEILFFGCLIITRARGAWFIAALYIAYVLFREKNTLRRRFRVVGTALVILFIVVFAVTSAAPELFRSPLLGGLRSTKIGPVAARLSYWEQGVRAFLSRPAFGTGLGTFYLSSVRYQAQPNSYSWFAHSYPLQTAVEVGVVGLIGISGLVWVASRRATRSRKGDAQPLFEAVVLSGLYSIFEINFDYLIIWLLVWSALGLLIGQGKMIRLPKTVFYVPLGFVALLYVIFVSTEAAQLLSKNRVFLQPYNTQRTLAFLSSRTADSAPSQKQLDTLLWFHKKNPEVLISAARAIQSNELFMRAIEQNPQRVEYFAEYVNLLVEQNNAAGLSRALNIDLSLSPFLTKELFSEVGRPSNKNEYFAKLYYFLGLKLLPVDPEQTRKLWILARDSAPDWGYFHVELAGLEYYTFHNKEEALRVLTGCRKFQFAADQCKNTVIDNAKLGDQYENIKAIPLFATK